MARRRLTSPTSEPKSSHPSATPPSLDLRPRQREIPRFEGGVQRAKIILGFSAIGKTHLAAKANREFEWLHVIDFSLIPQVLDITQDYKADYLQTIADAARRPGVLLLGGPRWVGEFLVANDLAFSSVYPTEDCKEEYITRWDQMGEEEGLIAHRLTWWDELIEAMHWPNGRCNHFGLYPGVYLEDMFMNILTAADQVDGIDDEEELDAVEESTDLWYDAHEAPKSPIGSPMRMLSRRNRSQAQMDTIQQVLSSLNSSRSSRIRAALNHIFLLFQFLFLCTLATLIILAYQEWNIWLARNRPNLSTIGEFSAPTRIHYTFNRWLLPNWLSTILPNSRETWLGASAFRQDLVTLIQKWTLDLEELLLQDG